VETNLPGITLPIEMARGSLSLSFIIILRVICLKKTHNQHPELSDQIGAITDYCRKNQIEKVIIDVSKQINLPESVDSFNLGVETAIRAKDFELGLLADTKSENLKLYVDTCASRGLTIELFYRFQDALNWLENQTPQS
jgi:hypothetical protein